MPAPVDLGRGRLLLDLNFRDNEGLVACYALPADDGWTLVETGPTTCREALLAALHDAGIERPAVTRVLVTHIHLDHAGGVGALADALPHATFFAHEKGVKHLIDPSRLVASARRAWGAAADPLWGPILPTDPGRIRSLSGGERFTLQGGDLEVIATPGHAQHHLSFFDRATRAVLTGDSAGVRVDSARRARPAIPPPDLDLGQLYASLEEMVGRAPEQVWYSHFGRMPGAVEALRRYHATVAEWVGVARAQYAAHPEVEAIARALREHEEAYLSSSGGGRPVEDRGTLVSGYDLAAQGLVRYFQTHPTSDPG